MKKVWVMMLKMGNKYSVRVFNNAGPAYISAEYYNQNTPVKAEVICLPVTKDVKFLDNNKAPFYIEEN